MFRGTSPMTHTGMVLLLQRATFFGYGVPHSRVGSESWPWRSGTVCSVAPQSSNVFVSSWFTG